MQVFYNLRAKTIKGAKHLADAGNPKSWELIEKRYNVPHNERPGPWLLLRPYNVADPVYHQRWVHTTDDTHYVVREQV